MVKPVLFLDDGGVISDNSRRAPQWQRLVGQFFAPILGGRPEEWEDANKVFITSLFEPAAWEARLNRARDYADYERTYLLDWIGGMCALMNVTPPPEEESIELTRRANAWIIPQVRADFPGVVDTVRLLHDEGYDLYTASGESSADLEGYLGTLGIRDCFKGLYGVDLINTLKGGPEFYERLLSDAGIQPRDAIIVDDSPHAVSWAMEAGARAVLVTSVYKGPIPPGVLFAIGSLAELPAALPEFE
ncbi:MAG TPA: HAD family hydrolase [Chloroflexia bacterium]|nr:HAD family hydrolase [Chloroflexia bacterium]